MEQLSRVDPSNLKHEEKLAFWINLYNALLMHVSPIDRVIELKLSFCMLVLVKVLNCWCTLVIFSLLLDMHCL